MWESKSQPSDVVDVLPFFQHVKVSMAEFQKFWEMFWTTGVSCDQYLARMITNEIKTNLVGKGTDNTLERRRSKGST